MVGISSLPYLYGWWATPPGWTYLGVHTNFDDQAVYAAWIKQAQEGRFFFENRFTTDPQPRLTVHLYFWLLGQLSVITGIPLAMHMGRIVFSILFLLQLRKLISRYAPDEFTRNVMWGTSAFGGGLGWLAWQRYGHDAPIDVWQPEAFTFPSLMTNCLFPPALWLIVLVWNALLDARESWRPVGVGAVGSFLLANIHTYDVLTVGLIAVAFLANQWASRTVSAVWLGRSFLIILGAFPPLGWLAYVWANDPVFAERAATPTFSPPLARVLGGYGVLLGLTIMTWLIMGKERGRFGLAGVCSFALLGMLACLLFLQKSYAGTDLWLSPPGWLALFAGSVFLCVLYAPSAPAWGLCFCWIVAGITALYFPALFQRKLTMGLQIPLGIGAGWFLAHLVSRFSPRLRFSLATLGVILIGLSSFKWLEREMQMARDNISNTAMHSPYLDPDATTVLKMLQSIAKPGDVVLSAPGVSAQRENGDFVLLIPDLNPVFTGWGGFRTWASHWSETPQYRERRAILARSLFTRPLDVVQARLLLSQTQAKFLCVPVSPVEELGIPVPEDYQNLGIPLYQGKTFWLFQVTETEILRNP